MAAANPERSLSPKDAANPELGILWQLGADCFLPSSPTLLSELNPRRVINLALIGRVYWGGLPGRFIAIFSLTLAFYIIPSK